MMTFRNFFALALIACVAGAFIGRAMPRDALSAPPDRSASSAPSAAVPAGDGCDADRSELKSIRAQLAICMIFNTRGREAEPSGSSEAAEPAHPEEPIDPQSMPGTEEIRRNRKLLDSYPEAVIVRHNDGSTGIYRPDEWPVDGDGEIIARKLQSGEIGWYAGPSAGPRSDPAAFRPSDPPEIPPITWGREADGTITINGKRAPPQVQRMFGGKVDEPAKRQQ
ncbi:hypothetical protein [Sorangium sp. So ce1000]|uniref:hypothetical protein n=1 Tax=Sorangium sp. So ce1000 TaxID=3133325 RepID=UPI003F6190EF